MPTMGGQFITVGGLGHPDMVFDGRKPHSGCMLCGKVYQSDLDRLDNPTPVQWRDAKILRDNWRIKHAKTHPASAHIQLRRSGMLCTAEAAHRLATFNIAPITDLVQSEEHAAAAAEAPRAPTQDADGT